MASVMGRYAAGRVVKDDGRNGVRPRVERREERVDLGNRASEPPEAGEEHELELRHHRAGSPQEQVVEAAVLEVVLDAGSADPADPAVDDHDLAVIDVAERGKVPSCPALASERPDRRTRLRRPGDADLDPGASEPLVERSRILLGLRALAVDDEPDRDSLVRLRNQRLGEGVPDVAGPEPELIDVNRGRRGADVLEHRRVEVPPLDVNVDGRRAALGEREPEVVPAHRP